MIKGYTSSQKTGPQKYATIKPLGSGKYGTEVLPKALSAVTLVDLVPEATSTEDTIVLTGHSVKKDDVIRFTGGTLDYQEVTVASVTANEIKLVHKYDTAITPADTFINLRTVTLTIAKSGELSTSSGPIQFIKDGLVQQVIEDTGTPANNAPLPVKLTGVTGDVNITAGDLNVQTSHVGASFDSQRIGDGTNVWGINASTEGLVRDADAITALGLLGTEVTSAAILAKIIAAPATEAKQDTAITRLNLLSTEAKQDTMITALGLLGTEVTLAAILAKLIAAPSTEAKQDTVIAALAETNKTIHRVGGSFNASQALDVTTGVSIGTVAGAKVGTEIEVSYKNGDPISLHDAATGGNLLGYVNSGGGVVKLNNLAATGQIYARAISNFTATDLTVNLNGKDA